MTRLLEAHGVSAGYGAISAIQDVSLTVEAGEVVALLGANGAGKSTTLLTLAGVLAPTAGEVHLLGRRTRAPIHKRARAGLSFMAGGRTVITGLSTSENLRIGAGPPARAFEMFPELKPLSRRRAGLLSGGEQQMLSLARALASRPKVLVLDELSLGLAPMIVRRLYEVVRAVADEGIGVLIVEQHLGQALKVSDRAYVMRRGRIAMSGSSNDLRDDLARVEELYLPESEAVSQVLD